MSDIRVSIEINRREYNVWIDDEGTHKELGEPVPSINISLILDSKIDKSLLHKLQYACRKLNHVRFELGDQAVLQDMCWMTAERVNGEYKLWFVHEHVFDRWFHNHKWLTVRAVEERCEWYVAVDREEYYICQAIDGTFHLDCYMEPWQRSHWSSRWNYVRRFCKEHNVRIDITRLDPQTWFIADSLDTLLHLMRMSYFGGYPNLLQEKDPNEDN